MALPHRIGRSSSPPPRSREEELAAANAAHEAGPGPPQPWYPRRSLYDLGKKPAIMKLIQILFQVRFRRGLAE